MTTTPGLEWKSRWRLADSLERELPRKLKDSWIERRVDLAKIGVVDAKRVRHREISVVEDVERLETQLDTKPFFEPDSLDERGVDVPVTRSIDGRQTEMSDGTG